MKKFFWRWSLAVGIASLIALGIHFNDREARAQTTPAPTPSVPAASPRPDAPEPLPAAKSEVSVAPGLAVPENVRLSPALTELVKLVRAGLSEDVLSAYVTNSTDIYGITSDALLYLTDLGLSDALLTAVVRHDAQPEIVAKKQALASAPQPLPPGVAVTKPVNLIVPKALPQPVAPPGNADLGAAPPPGLENGIPQTQLAVAPPAQTVSTAYFQSELAPYGSWITVPGYGLCWQPTVAVVDSYWAPYRDRGRWLWTDSGWYWNSDYTWGWAPFHYGRWCQNSGLGWFWVPDNCWGPAWVSWRSHPSYCGWAPLPPDACFTDGIGFSYWGSHVGFGFDFGVNERCWNWIPRGHFCDRRPHLYFVSPSFARTIHRESVITAGHSLRRDGSIRNVGLGLETIAKSTRGEIQLHRIVPATQTRLAGTERIENQGHGPAIVSPQLPKPDASGRILPTTVGKVQPCNSPVISRINGNARGNSAPPRPNGTAQVTPAIGAKTPIWTRTPAFPSGNTTPPSGAAAPATSFKPGSTTVASPSSQPGGPNRVNPAPLPSRQVWRSYAEPNATPLPTAMGRVQPSINQSAQSSRSPGVVSVAPTFRNDSYRASPAPVYSAPTYSAPVYSAPAVRAPSPSAPVYQAPSRSVTAPAPSQTTTSHSSDRKGSR